MFDVAEGVIRGWAHGGDGQAALVTVSRDGETLGTVKSAERLSAFLPLPPGSRNRGFAFDLGRLWQEAEEEFAVDIGLGPDAAPIVRDLVVYPPAATVEQLLHDGSCENNKAGMIRGWVWRRDRPEVPADVALYLDGQLWRVEQANQFRQDLLAAGKGTGAHGFAVPVPVAKDAVPMLVDVRLAGTGLRLRRSPLRIEGRTVTVVG